MEFTSPALSDEGHIHDPFVCRALGGQNRSLPFQWGAAPEGTRSFALSIVDPHPMANNLVHWLVVDIPAGVDALRGGVSGKEMPPGARELRNGFGHNAYEGPQPPRGSGENSYVCTLYALNAPQVEVTGGTSLEAFEGALEGRVLETAQVVGNYGT